MQNNDKAAPSEPRPSVRIKVNTQVFVESVGDGADVVLMHGAAMAPAALVPLARALMTEFRVSVVHRSGYGRSAPVLPYDATDSLERLEAALLGHGVQRPLVIGVSGAAEQAIALAERQRLGVRGLVLLGAGSYGSETRRTLRGVARSLRTGRPDLESLAQRMVTDRPRSRSALASWLQAVRAEDLADELCALADAPGDSRAKLAALQLPTLLRIGALDRMGPADYHTSTRSLWPHARVEEVADCGHSLLLEDFSATLESVRGFLREHAAELAGLRPSPEPPQVA